MGGLNFDAGGLIVVAAVLAALGALVTWVFVAHRDILWQILTPREWRVLAKLVAIALLALVLLQADIAFQIDAEKFIYGRF